MADLSPESVERIILETHHWHKLRNIRNDFQEGFKEQHLTASSITDHVTSMNAIHDAIIRRAIQLAEAELREEGQGEPPVPYSFILFGSGGRSEQNLWSDQDNGLIYDVQEPDETDAIHQYYEKLAARIRSGLESLGYPPCEGNVICTNARWRKPLRLWLDMIDEWLHEPDFENVRYLLIVADSRSVYGDARLCLRLKDRLFAYTRHRPELLQAMVNNTLRHKVLLGPFGNLLREQYGEDAGSIDIKYGSYIPMVNGIRMLAIRESIHASSTIERIAALRAAGAIYKEMLDLWEEAFQYSLRLRFMTPGHEEGGWFTTNGKLMVNGMSRQDIQQLKRCLRIGRQLQKYVQKHGARPI